MKRVALLRAGWPNGELWGFYQPDPYWEDIRFQDLWWSVEDTWWNQWPMRWEL